MSIKWGVQSETLTGRVGLDTAVRVGFRNELFAASVNKQTDEIGAHVVA